MGRPVFSVVWQRIQNNAGQHFETKRGVQFAYTMEADGFFPQGRNHRIDISDIENAYRNVPCEGPSQISRGVREVRGSSYLWAVLHDHRIRQNDW